MDRQVWIRSLGVYVPEDSLTNEELAEGMPWLDTSPQWIAEHTGIRARRVARPDQDATDLGFAAAKEALALSGLGPGDVDLVLLATNTNPQIYPAGAARIQAMFGEDGKGRLAMADAGALDLQQGCASFLGGIGLASGLLKGGAFGCILVVGADVATRMVDWTDRDSILLGDAAAACVMTAGDEPGDLDPPPLEVLGHFMRTDPRQADAISQEGPLDRQNHPRRHFGAAIDPQGPPARKQLYETGCFGGLEDGEHCFFRMDGRQVYRFVKRTVPREGYLEVMRRAGLCGDEPEEWRAYGSLAEVRDRELRRRMTDWLASKVDLFVPHSANLSLNQELAEELGIPFERMYVTLHKYANTSAASVGLSLYEALRGAGHYVTLTKRDGKGNIKVPAREIRPPRLDPGQVALLLSFGAGNSWNYLVVRVAPRSR